MKKSSKALAMLLAAVMLFSCAGVAAFADSPEYTQEDFTYVCFGDSYTRGMGCSDTWEQDTKLDYSNYEHQSRNVPGAYPYIVAQTLGCDTETANGYLDESDATYWPLIQNGQTLGGVMDFLGIDDGYYDSYFYHSYSLAQHGRRYDKFVKYFGNPDSKWGGEDSSYGDYGTVYDARELIADADLITIQLGMGDVINRPVFAALDQALGEDWDKELDISALTAEDYARVVAQITENCTEGFEYFKRAYPMLVEYLQSTSDAEIMVISAVNPVFGVTISNEILAPVGNLVSALTMGMNEFLKGMAEDYGIAYIDISNVDTSSNTNDWSLIDDLFGDDKYEVGTHPSPEGHAQIARQILRAYNGTDTAKKYQVKLDIGRFDGVTSVLLDGKSTTNYTLDDNKYLTVNCGGYSAKSLTITYVTPEGKIVTSTYELTWSAQDGYSAYRVYTTNDLTGVVTTIVTKTVGVFKSLVSKLFR